LDTDETTLFELASERLKTALALPQKRKRNRSSFHRIYGSHRFQVLLDCRHGTTPGRRPLDQ
jgi:hypothetical protein